MKFLYALRALLVIAFVSVLTLLTLFIAGLMRPTIDGVELPSQGRVRIIGDNTYIYGSNSDLSKLLTQLDIHFKAQGLSSDADSPIFEYPELAAGTTATSGTKLITNCVEFNYYKNTAYAARFTLLPQKANCYTDDDDLLESIADQHTKYQHVYVIEANKLKITD